LAFWFWCGYSQKGKNKLNFWYLELLLILVKECQ